MQKDLQAVQEREFEDLESKVKQLKAALRELLYQVEFHADEYKDNSDFSYEQKQLTSGVATRFESLATTIKGVLEDYPQIETKKG